MGRKLKITVWLAVLCMLLGGCGKKPAEMKQGGTVCRDFDHAGYTAEGMVYQDYSGNLVKYLDYEREEFYSLCSRPNCLHDSDECTARALCGQISFMGRLGDKWYYYQPGEEGESFHVCDLDGGNDRVIGSWPYEEGSFSGNVWGNVLFQDRSCFLALGVDNMEEDPDNPGSFGGVSVTGNIYRYDLDTGELSELAVSASWSGDYMNENFLVYNEAAGEGERLVELDLETGEKTVVFEGGYASGILWEKGLKAFLVLDPAEEGNKNRVYQYTDQGECTILYEGDVFVPYALGGDLVIGQDADWDRAIIKKEDFLAGKMNWTKIVEPRDQ